LKVKNAIIFRIGTLFLCSYFGLKKRSVLIEVHMKRHPCGLLMIVYANRDPLNLLHRKEESQDSLNTNDQNYIKAIKTNHTYEDSSGYINFITFNFY
jgi:hypothetical protein